MTGSSVGAVIATLGLDAGALVAGAGGLDHPAHDVRLCDASSLPLDSAVGCILVSTSRPDAVLELQLQGLKAAGAVAVVLGADPADVLTSTRWIADRLRLPLLAVPGGDLLDLAFRIKDVVVGPEVASGLQLRALSSRIKGAACDPETAVELVRDVVDVDCAVIGADAIVLAGRAPTAWDPARQSTVAGITTTATATTVSVPVHSVADAERGADLWLVAQLGGVTRDRADGVLRALEMVALGLVAWAAINRLEAQRDDSMKAAVLMQVMTCGGGVPAHLLEQTLALGWSLTGWHTAVCLRPLSASPLGSGDGLSAQVQRSVRQLLPRFEVVRSGTHWLCWASQRVEPTAEEADALVETLESLVLSLGYRVVAGLGSARSGAAGFIDTLVESQGLAGSAGRVAGRRPVEHAQASAHRRLILAATNGAAVAERSNQILRPLIEADPALLETLETYLALESSKAATATAQHMHRNTVIKRLERIERLLDVSLDDPEVRLALRLACRGRGIGAVSREQRR